MQEYSHYLPRGRILETYLNLRLGSNWRAVEISNFISFKPESFLLIINKSVLSFWNSKN